MIVSLRLQIFYENKLQRDIFFFFNVLLTKERKQRHNYIKLRGRTEASWSFTQYPLDVTKVLTIPWEFKMNVKSGGRKKAPPTFAALKSLVPLHLPPPQNITHFLSGIMMTKVSVTQICLMLLLHTHFFGFF